MNQPALSQDDYDYHKYVQQMIIETRAIQEAWLSYLSQKYQIDLKHSHYISPDGLIQTKPLPPFS